MRTNIDIDDALIAEAMQLTGNKTKRDAVNEALRMTVERLRQAGLRRYKGTLSDWDGDLDEMRTDR